MNLKLLLVFILFWSLDSFCQEIQFFNQRPKKNLFLDFAGNGGLVSINHEKIHLISFKLMMVHKIGLGVSQDYAFIDPSNYYVSIPVNLTFCFGKRRLLFDAGIGTTIFLKVNEPFYELSFYPVIGYRFQPLKANKIYAKITASLPQNLSSSNFSIVNSEVLFIPIGVSIGKSF